jgi:hypothetical protein
MKIALVVSSFIVAYTAAFQPVHVIAQGRSTRLELTTRRDWVQSAVVGSVTLVTGAASASAEGRPMYLTDPTDEFKANEAKAAEFKRAQLLVKKDFLKVIDRLSTESTSEQQLTSDLNELQDLVIKTSGLPLGIKKEELYKIIRRKKSLPAWTTPVEYA